MSQIGAWTTSAQFNTAASPDGWPEGMLPLGDNDGGRELHAAVRAYAVDAEWFDWGHSPVRLGNKSFLVSLTATLIYSSGRVLRLADGATRYVAVNGSALSGANTVVSVTGTSNIGASLSSLAVGRRSPLVPGNQYAAPIGTVLAFAGSSVPLGYLACYGQAVSRTTFAPLFDKIGTTYGVGNGSTTFNLPDMRGRAIFGRDNMGGSAANRVTAAGSGVTGSTLGAVGGSQLMHAHTHSQGLGSAGNLVGGGSPGGGAVDTGQTGSGGSQNMPPGIILQWVIKT